MSIPTTLHSFSRLPIELRIRIWTYAFPPPKLISIVACTEDEVHYIAQRPSLPFMQSKERCSTLIVTKHHPLFHVNHESRNLVLKNHHLLPYTSYSEQRSHHSETQSPPPVSDSKASPSYDPSHLLKLNLSILASTKNPYTLFNPLTSLLFLADPPPSRNGIVTSTTTYSSLSILFSHLPHSFTSSLKILALSYYTWRKDRKFNLLHLLYQFLSLDKLYICFVGAGTEWVGGEKASGGGGGGWLDAVRREGDDLDQMVRGVEKEVLEDIEDLGRVATMEGRVWRRPVVRVLRDRKAVAKDWEGGV